MCLSVCARASAHFSSIFHYFCMRISFYHFAGPIFIVHVVIVVHIFLSFSILLLNEQTHIPKSLKYITISNGTYMDSVCNVHASEQIALKITTKYSQ